MKAVRCAALGSLLLVVPRAFAAVSCTGVLDYDDGVFSGRFHCRYHGPVLRRVLATCHDGETGCDADGACNGACTFAVCADAGCAGTFGVTVPLRRNGAAKGRAVVRTARARMVLRCLPPRGACGPGASTTTSTTTTTLPARACRATLSGAATGAVDCTASLSVGGLGLPTLVIQLEGEDVVGQAAVLMTSSTPGTYHLGQGVVLAVAAFSRPELPAFQATQQGERQMADVVLDSVSAGAFSGALRARGTLNATLAAALSSATLQLAVEF